MSLLTGTLAVALFLTETRQPDSPPRGDEEDEEEEESVLALGAVLRDGRLATLLLPLLLLQVTGSWIESVLPLAANDAGTITPPG